MVVQDDVVDADAAAGFDGFGSAPHCQLSAAFLVVPRIAVGDRHEPDLVAGGSPFGGDAPRADVAIVRMRAKRDNAQRLLRVRGRGKQGE